MNPDLIKKLREWRDATAKKEGVEGFRVVPNRSIEDIAMTEPKTRDELTSIKGIKDKKYYKYGMDILEIVKSESGFYKFRGGKSDFKINRQEAETEKRNSIIDPFETNNRNATGRRKDIYSVGEFLDMLNDKLLFEKARLKGEITSIDEREKVVYFSMKDGKDESVINCLIFRYQYDISGVRLKIGEEVIADGYPQIYKPTGRLSLKVDLIEIAGEGALKKAYDELKMKMEMEGIFSPERKKKIPELPETIGLITSNQGAAIGDFTTNIGNYGFKIKFINSSVEGKQAVFELIRAVKTIKKISGIDVLVIIRGGGSLESLQAFNNEALVREIASLKIPVICGVGHERDISLVSMASDLSVSTPTAAARAVRESWDRASQKTIYSQAAIFSIYERSLRDCAREIDMQSQYLNRNFDHICNRFENAIINFRACSQKISSALYNCKKSIDVCGTRIFSGYERMIALSKDRIRQIEEQIKLHDPARQLKLGYSISLFEGKIIRSVSQIKIGDKFEVKISDGELRSTIDEISRNRP